MGGDLVAMPEKKRETTEWEDTLKKFGITNNEGELEITQEKLEELAVDMVENYDPLEHKTLEQLDELEDDEDERVLEEYRQKRIAEMKAKALASRYGSVVQISEPEYTKETQSGDVWTVIHLFKPGLEACDLMNKCLERLANKFKTVKFLKITATEAIHNYPDRNLPTLILYHENDIQGQIIGLSQVGGMGMTPDSLEWKLSRFGAVDTELEDNPLEARKQLHREEGRRNRGFVDSDSDSD
eukprot:GFYU01002460.1.p1 GENE.GFYU01002460.1~~GFYU01002460.1.p1  ORF type:complete len:241 (+),score=106.59 GFYU01002460.1:62-784(+)